MFSDTKTLNKPLRASKESINVMLVNWKYKPQSTFSRQEQMFSDTKTLNKPLRASKEMLNVVVVNDMYNSGRLVSGKRECSVTRQP
jgi:hypothetical protein